MSQLTTWDTCLLQLSFFILAYASRVSFLQVVFVFVTFPTEKKKKSCRLLHLRSNNFISLLVYIDLITINLIIKGNLLTFINGTNLWTPYKGLEFWTWRHASNIFPFSHCFSYITFGLFSHVYVFLYCFWGSNMLLISSA